MFKNNFITLVVAFFISISATGCLFDSDSGDNTPEVLTGDVAFVSTAGDNSGAHSAVQVDSPYKAITNYVPTGTSDVTMASYGKHFYRIERMNRDSIAKFHKDKPGEAVWQYSTRDSNDSASPNTHSIVFASETKAYVIRYESSTVWIVNPSAASQAAFKIGTLDLSSYLDGADADGNPDLETGIIVGTKLYILVQNIDMASPWAKRTSYIAVFDTTTDTEIDTGQGGSSGHNGIELGVKNPASIMEYGGSLYVGSPGSWWGSGNGEGLQKIDATTYVPGAVWFSGTLITNVTVVSATKGYFIQYEGWDNTNSVSQNKVYTFNPTTGALGSALSGVGTSQNDLAVDKNGYLWIGDHTPANPGIYILNPSDDEVLSGTSPISVGLKATKIVFCYD